MIIDALTAEMYMVSFILLDVFAISCPDAIAIRPISPGFHSICTAWAVSNPVTKDRIGMSSINQIDHKI